MQLERVCHDALPWLISFSLDGMSQPTKTGLCLIAPLPVAIVAFTAVYSWPTLLLLPGETFSKGHLPVVMQFVVLTLALSIPAFLIGLLLVAADFLRRRRDTRASSV